jgi:predicted phage terminase large subunit-like protein
MTNPLVAALIAAIDEDERYDWRAKARPEQLPPEGPWTKCLMKSGRGAGKTRSGAEWLREQVRQGRRRAALVAATSADARDVMVEGESGVLAVCPPSERPTYEPSKRRLTWPNGAVGTLFSAEEPDRLRGPQHDVAWADEVATWQDAPRGDALGTTWNNLMLGLRLGPHPRVLATTTPRMNRLIVQLVNDPACVTIGGSTYDNLANLAPTFRAQILASYEGTRIGRQELNGELLTDVPGALWTLSQLGGLRAPMPSDMVRVVVAVDPSGGHGDGNDEQGIVVCGIAKDGTGYVLADRSCRLSPDGWGRRAVAAYIEFAADRLLWEANYGGEMVEAVVNTAARAMGVTVATRRVTASRGKRLRAEPIAALFEQGRVKLVGEMSDLEDQLVSFTPESGGSPDRLDAMVMALTDLILRRVVTTNLSGFAEANAQLRRSSPFTSGVTPRALRAW